MPRLASVITDIRSKCHPSGHWSVQSVLAIAAAAIAIATLSPPASAADAPKVVPPATQVWLINTRCAPGCGNLEAGLAQLTYWRLDESSGCGQWQASDAASFQASAAPDVPTTVLVHGYGTDPDWAVRHGYEVYGLMKQQACGHAFRLVVWSWPAEHEGRYRPDVQMKICRSDAEAYYLARVFSSLPKGTPLGLIGYSIGCGTVSGALELWAGGPVAGRGLNAEALATWKNAGPRPIRVMMLAPAVDADSLEPYGARGLAPLAVERILVAKDCSDRALRLYSRIYCRRGPQALGHSGPTGDAGGKLEVVDVSCEVGRKHDFDLYTESSPVVQRLAWYTFLSSPATVVATADKSDLVANNRPAE